MYWLTLRRFNHIITALVIGVALYIGSAPLLPWLDYMQKKSRNDPAPYGMLGSTLSADTAANKTIAKPLPSDNRIVIPSAFVDEPIKEGSSLATVDRGGVWNKKLWVKSPKEPGNALMLGHRFGYKHPKGAFYSLDKVKVGDKLAIYWQGEELLYQVVDRKEVTPDKVEVENNTTDRQLTLYTCTPLATAKNRLVIVAKPIN